MGAVGALMFAVRHPERVSRIISVFGAFDLADLRTRSEKLQSSIDSVYPTPELLTEATPYNHISQLRRFAIRLFHGLEDTLVPCEYSERLCRLLLAAGGDATLTLVPGVGHSNDILVRAQSEFFAALDGT